MDKRAGRDFISELPQSIIETILSKLPITDVVKTSFLSTSWRYKWTSLPNLVFDDFDIDKNDEELVTFIDRFLLLHNGPIRKFSVFFSAEAERPQLYQWLLFVSRKDVKELSVICATLKVPSCILSCKNLTHLKLDVCDMVIPVNFEGFPCLRHLDFDGDVYSEDGLASLVSKSLCLERLTLRILNQCVCLTIYLPNLQYLDVTATSDIVMTYCPRLVEIYARLEVRDKISELTDRCFFHDFLGSATYLEILNVSVHFMEYSLFRSGLCCSRLLRRQIKLVHLKSLEITGINHELQDYVRVTQLINVCPNLTSLTLSIGYSEDDSNMHVEVEENALSLGTMAKLKTVMLKEIRGMPYEMKLIELLLGSSPGLEKMHILIDVYRSVSGKRRLEFYTQLLVFKRASSDASIVLKG